MYKPGKILLVVLISVLATLISACSNSKSTLNSTTTTISGATTTTLVSQVVLNSAPVSQGASFVGPVKRITLPYAVIGYRNFGSGSTLVLLPGEDDSMASWGYALLGALAKHYNVITLDYPGVGYSVNLSFSPFTINNLANLTAGFLRGIGVSNASFLGWGMGGEVSLELAINYPQLVNRIILVGASAGGPQSTVPPKSVSSLLSDPNSTFYQLASLLFPPGDTFDVQSYISQVNDIGLEPISNEAVTQEYEAVSQFFSDSSVVNAASKIDAPALIIDGNLDQIFPVQNSDNLAALLTFTTKLIKNNAGNGVLFQDGSSLLNLIEAFTG